MRVSANQRAKGTAFTVSLDGVDISDRCYVADDETGLAWTYSVDVGGHKFIDPDTGDAARSCLKGQVVITKL